MERKEKFYSIGEVSKLTEIPSHILRYWEKELNLKIMRDQKGNRIYTKKDLEMISEIKTLIYKQGYKIKGVKKKIRGEKLEDSTNYVKVLKKILKKIEEIKKCLE